MPFDRKSLNTRLQQKELQPAFTASIPQIPLGNDDDQQNQPRYRDYSTRRLNNRDNNRDKPQNQNYNNGNNKWNPPYQQQSQQVQSRKQDFSTDTNEHRTLATVNPYQFQVTNLSDFQY